MIDIFIDFLYWTDGIFLNLFDEPISYSIFFVYNLCI